ncbi:MAG: hypothetical protein ACFFB3_12970 [Candidatus Hodarchaeota archaeon]
MEQAIIMGQISTYTQLWEYCRLHGLKTIEIIEEGNAWGFRVNSNEFSVKETFRHTAKSIFEDAGNWFLADPTPYNPLEDPIEDLNRALDRMIRAKAAFSDNDLSGEFTFQWGEKTTVAGVIKQNLFHAVVHFSQLRNWVGIHRRAKKEKLDRVIL